MSKFVFDTTGPNKELWTWQKLDDKGVVIQMAATTFPFYLDAATDAAKHGFDAPVPFKPRVPRES